MPRANTMHVQIDNTATAISLEGLANFGELMRRIEAEHIPAGRVVTAVVLNEEALSIEQEELLHGFGLEDVGSLALATAEPGQLAIESLLHALDYLPALADELERLPRLIRAGQMREALGHLEGAFEVLAHFLAMLEGVRSVLKLDFSQILLEEDEGGSLAAMHAKLQKLLEAMETVAQEEDWNQAAELAGYELAPLVYQFMGAMPLLVEEAVRRVPHAAAAFATHRGAPRVIPVTPEVEPSAGPVGEEVTDSDEAIPDLPDAWQRSGAEPVN